jgi:hypothetical protein
MSSPSILISPVDPADVDGVVHPVEAAQEGGLAAARRTDEGGHGLVSMSTPHVLDGVGVAVDTPAHCALILVEIFLVQLDLHVVHRLASTAFPSGQESRSVCSGGRNWVTSGARSGGAG